MLLLPDTTPSLLALARSLFPPESRAHAEARATRIYAAALGLRGSVELYDVLGGLSKPPSPEGEEEAPMTRQELASLQLEADNRIAGVRARMTQLFNNRARAKLPDPHDVFHALGPAGLDPDWVDATASRYVALLEGTLDRIDAETKLLMTEARERAARGTEALTNLLAIDRSYATWMGPAHTKMRARLAAAYGDLVARTLERGARSLALPHQLADVAAWFADGGIEHSLHLMGLQLSLAYLAHDARFSLALLSEELQCPAPASTL